MGNQVASTKRKHFSSAQYDQLLPMLDPNKPDDALIHGMALFAQGSLDEFLSFATGKLADIDASESPTAQQRTMQVGLSIELSFVLFLVHGGLSGAEGEQISRATECLEEAFEVLVTTQLGTEYSSLIDACLLMFKGHKKQGNKAYLTSVVQRLGPILKQRPSSGDDLHFLHHFLATIIHGLCTLKLFHLTHDLTYLRASSQSTWCIDPLIPPHHLLRDVWLQEMVLLDIWSAIASIPDHYRLCDRDPSRVAWDNIGDVFVGQVRIIDELHRIFEQRQRNLLPADRPLVLWFSGASGHGKTYLAQLIADILHKTDGSPQEAGKLVVINCQNLRTAESVNSLVDPPTGIKGSGPLISGLEKNNDAVVLLDELDKAMVTAVETIFLPAFERGGYLQSAKDGRVVRTSKAVFIITSNFGAEVIHQDSEIYISGTTEERNRLELAWRRAIVSKLQETYAPPFLNRTTAHLFLFTPYTAEECERAVDLEMQRWATHLLKAGRLVVQWTRSVTKFFADNFEQFHGQKVVTACADCLNRAINAGHTSNYFLLRAVDKTLLAQPLQSVVSHFRAPPHVLQSILPPNLFPPEAPLPSTGQAILDHLLFGLLPLEEQCSSMELSSIPSTTNPIHEVQAPDGVLEEAAGATDGPVLEHERSVELEPERAIELQVVQQRALEAEAELEQLREQLKEAKSEVNTVKEAILNKDAEIAQLKQTIQELQLSLVAQFAIICGMMWVISWLLPTKLLICGFVVATAVVWQTWEHIAWWLLPLLRILRTFLGDGGTLAVVFFFLAAVIHRLQGGHLQIGYPT